MAAGSSSYLPNREAPLDDWASTFNTKIVAGATSFGLVAAQSTAFTALFNTWHSAYLAAINNSTRTPVAIQTKNTAKAAMIDGPGGVRELVGIIQNYPPLTNSQRVELGITVPDVEPSPVPPPSETPVLIVKQMLDRVLTLAIRSSKDDEKRGKPEGVAGATVLMFVGEEAPLDPTKWVFLAGTTKTTIVLDFPSTIAAGAKVWLTAFWKNRKEQTGPAATPISVRLGDALAMAA